MSYYRLESDGKTIVTMLDDVIEGQHLVDALNDSTSKAIGNANFIVALKKQLAEARDMVSRIQPYLSETVIGKEAGKWLKDNPEEK